MRRPGRRTLAALALLAAVGFGVQIALGAESRAAQGNPTAGKTVFQNTCVACHTLKAAGSTATIGPNLDTAPQRTLSQIEKQVSDGGATLIGSGAAAKYPVQMPAYKGTLSATQIADVSAFVYQSTHATAAPTPTTTKAKTPTPTPTPTTTKAAPTPTTTKAKTPTPTPTTTATRPATTTTSAPAATTQATTTTAPTTTTPAAPQPPKATASPGFTG